VKIQKLYLDDKEIYCSLKKMPLGSEAEQEVKILLEKAFIYVVVTSNKQDFVSFSQHDADQQID